MSDSETGNRRPRTVRRSHDRTWIELFGLNVFDPESYRGITPTEGQVSIKSNFQNRTGLSLIDAHRVKRFAGAVPKGSEAGDHWLTD